MRNLRGEDELRELRRWTEEGLSAAPEKYQKLAELNKLLAHQPWRITKKIVGVCFTSF